MVTIWYQEWKDASAHGVVVKNSKFFSDISEFIDWIFDNEGEYEKIYCSCTKDGVLKGVHPLQSWKGEEVLDQPWYDTESHFWYDTGTDKFSIKKQWYTRGSSCHVVELYRIDVDGKCYAMSKYGGERNFVSSSFVNQIMAPCIERKKKEFDVVYAD